MARQTRKDRKAFLRMRIITDQAELAKMEREDAERASEIDGAIAKLQAERDELLPRFEPNGADKLEPTPSVPIAPLNPEYLAAAQEEANGWVSDAATDLTRLRPAEPLSGMPERVAEIRAKRAGAVG